MFIAQFCRPISWRCTHGRCIGPNCPWVYRLICSDNFVISCLHPVGQKQPVGPMVTLAEAVHHAITLAEISTALPSFIAVPSIHAVFRPKFCSHFKTKLRFDGAITPVQLSQTSLVDLRGGRAMRLVYIPPLALGTLTWTPAPYVAQRSAKFLSKFHTLFLSVYKQHKLRAQFCWDTPSVVSSADLNRRSSGRMHVIQWTTSYVRAWRQPVGNNG